MGTHGRPSLGVPEAHQPLLMELGPQPTKPLRATSLMERHQLNLTRAKCRRLFSVRNSGPRPSLNVKIPSKRHCSSQVSILGCTRQHRPHESRCVCVCGGGDTKRAKTSRSQLAVGNSTPERQKSRRQVTMNSGCSRESTHAHTHTHVALGWMDYGLGGGVKCTSAKKAN